MRDEGQPPNCPRTALTVEPPDAKASSGGRQASRGSSSQRGFCTSPGFRHRTNRDLHIDLPVQLVEDGHEPVDGKATEPAIANTDELRLVHAAAGLGLAGGKAFVVQGADDAGCENRFCLTDIGAGMPEVVADVSSEVFDLKPTSADGETSPERQ